MCKLRFDDTNPTGEYADNATAIKADMEWLGFKPDGQTLYASDYFEQLYEWAEYLTANGLAYVDDQDAETIALNRGDFQAAGTDSPWRNRTPEENLRLLHQMRAGRFSDGEKVLRAKIDMAHDNMLMRDPVMYRIRHTSHFRSGDEWCIYPTYDWAHGQSDAIEGVTHSLCSLEFEAHRPLYEWFLDHLPLQNDRPQQAEFARLNLTHTITSKRQLAKLVDDNLVDGWNDPRMPTLRGLRRRGYPPEAIREFCGHIGVSRVNGVHEIELLESFVRNHHNRWALRRMAVLRPLEVVIHNWPASHVETRKAVNNPEDQSQGTRDVAMSGRLWIERDDFMVDPPRKFYRLAPGREVRLRASYFLRCEDFETAPDGTVVKLHCSYDPATGGGQAPDGRKVRSTIHWVSTEHAVDGVVALYDRLFTEPIPGENNTVDPLESYNPASRELITDAKLEPALAEVPPGIVVQFERLGYFARDMEPDSKLMFHRTVGLRDEWARIQKQRQRKR